MKVLPSSYTDNLAGKHYSNKNYSFSSLTRRLSNTAIASLLIVSVAFSLLIVKLGFTAGALILVVVIGLPIVYSVVVYPKAGILILLAAAFLLAQVSRLGVTFPLGTLMDALEVLLLLGLFIKQKNNPDWGFLKLPISKIILIWIFYNILEVINPAASSFFSWLYSIRAVATVMLLYFVFMHQINSFKFIRVIIKVWLTLAFLGAAYAFKQEHFGYFEFEKVELRNPRLISLYYIGGVWRKSSIFSDPVTFSYNMVISSLLCICLMTNKTFTSFKKYILLLLALFFLLNMLYSGTRGAYVLVPAALVLISVINYSPKVLIISIIAGMLIGAMIVIPTSNPTIGRFQSAFRPSEDASYLVRKINQKRIQPFILTHPLGGGLGATGGWGQRFAPNSYLANFPPDSGYVRVAVELGWIGLFLICLLMFTILKTGIKNYFLIQNSELKSYCLAATVIVFALNIGNFPQEAIVQFPTNILFVLAAALINVTLKLDRSLTTTIKDETSLNY